MTSKEKAEELVNKYMNIGQIKMSDHSRIYLPTAKQCALIAVDEILDYITTSLDIQTSLAAVNYWQEVKQEIEKL